MKTHPVKKSRAMPNEVCRLIAWPLLAVFLAISNVHAQMIIQKRAQTSAEGKAINDKPCSSDNQQAVATQLPHYEIRALADSEIVALRFALTHGCFKNAVAIYTRGSYQSALLSWVVYIDSADNVYQGFTSSDSVVAGQRYVWAMVFSDRMLASSKGSSTASEPAAQAAVFGRQQRVAISVGYPATGSNGTDATGLQFSRRAVVYGPNAEILTIVLALGRVIGLSAPATPVLNDSSEAVSLHRISLDTAHVSFYGGYSRFALVDNVQVELSLGLLEGWHFDRKSGQDSGAAPASAGHNSNNSLAIAPLQKIYANLANAKKPLLEAGVLLGASYGGSIPTYNASLQVQSVSPRWAANGYLIGSLNLFWFHLNRPPAWQPISVGGFAGTNFVTGSVGNELIAGLVLGHVVGDVGIAAGDASLPAQAIKTGLLHSYRQNRLIVGVVLGI